MNIAVLTGNYPAWTETFVRREVEALRDRGHRVAVFTGWPAGGPPAPPTEMPIASWHDINAIMGFLPDVLYGELGLHAHQRTLAVSRALRLPFALRLWCGYDTFVLPSPEFYANATADPVCRALLVEDRWMQRYACGAMAVREDTVRIVPNSLDLQRFRPQPGQLVPPMILGIGRFVPKKGFIHLVHAFRNWRVAAELRLIGDGPERGALEQAARGDHRITIGTPIPEADLPALYAQCTMLVAPCVHASDGDADGMPTVVLEAMACGRPIIMSDLLNAHDYLSGTGFFVPPGDEGSLTLAMQIVLHHPEMGWRARRWAQQHLDLSTNIVEIERALVS